jgi:hypothetical protein
MPKPTLTDVDLWDRQPAVRILTWSLAGPAFVSGDQVELESVLDELVQAGLVDYRLPVAQDFPAEGRPDFAPSTGMWVVTGTAAGHHAGLLLAASADLVQLLGLAARAALAGCGRAGVDHMRIVHELALRDVDELGELPEDIPAWFAGAARGSLSELPRRGALGRCAVQREDAASA